MPKNIVVFSDGTGQEGGQGNNTNVYKLFEMVTDRSKEQVAFYDRGLGTGWRRLTGNRFLARPTFIRRIRLTLICSILGPRRMMPTSSEREIPSSIRWDQPTSSSGLSISCR